MTEKSDFIARSKMTQKETLFIGYYLEHFNGSRAAREAGYSDESAGTYACELLKKPHIKEEIARQLESVHMSAREVLQRLAMMSRGEIPTRTVVRGKKVTETFDVESALTSVGKAHALFIDKQITQSLDGLEIVDDEETDSPDPVPAHETE